MESKIFFCLMESSILAPRRNRTAIVSDRPKHDEKTPNEKHVVEELGRHMEDTAILHCNSWFVKH